jgi:hypothetical protein
MPEVFSLNIPASESSAIRSIVRGTSDAAKPGPSAFNVMSKATVGKFAASPATFKKLANPSLPMNAPGNAPMSLQIFDKPAKEFEDITSEVTSRLKTFKKPNLQPNAALDPLGNPTRPQLQLQPPPPPKDPFLQRLHNIYLISEYLDNFPNELKCLEISKDELKNKTDEELASLVKQIRTILGGTRTGAFISSSIDKAVGIMESIAITNNYHVEGLSNTLKKDDEWKKLCKEAELAYCDWVNLSVEQRILFKVIETGTTLHERNRIMNTYQPDETCIDQSVAEEYSDLVE